MRASVNRPPTPDGDDDRESEPTLQEIVNIKINRCSYGLRFRVPMLVDRERGKGEIEGVISGIRERLIECGWRDELKAQCRAFTRKKGCGNITVDELVRTITPKGRALVPDNVKAELVLRIRTFLMTDPS